MNVIKRITEYIAREQMLSAGSRVVVGLSGGADSVALLSLLVRLGYDCVACHCNFMLRDEESLRDRNHARDVAQLLQVPFVETTFDTVSYARERSISIEMAARELRYEWFERMRVEYAADVVAVAHHRDDNVETLLLNLVRGTGIAGVTGMSPRNGRVVRPLLCLSREELLQYISDEGLEYVTDSTNLETVYTRNKIRLEVLPLLREINPSVDACIERSIDNLRECEKFYRASIEQWRDRVCMSKGNELYIDMQVLKTSPSPRTLLHEIVSPMGFAAEQVADMLRVGEQSGRQFLSATHRAVTHREQMILVPLSAEGTDDTLATWSEGDTSEQYGVAIRRCEHEGFEIIRSRHVACFDSDKVRFPLCLRRWRKGDSFVPFGMKGRKKVSDYFSDHKYSLVDKEKALILCDAEKILWIVGERAGNEARITQATTRVLVVESSISRDEE